MTDVSNIYDLYQTITVSLMFFLSVCTICATVCFHCWRDSSRRIAEAQIEYDNKLLMDGK